ncbi:hypothetical protein [Evansella clarkii]|nr:hypothetical protein [Evansella clarkii]
MKYKILLRQVVKQESVFMYGSGEERPMLSNRSGVLALSKTLRGCRS